MFLSIENICTLVAIGSWNVIYFCFHRYFGTTEQYIKKQIWSADLLGVLRKYSLCAMTPSLTLVYVYSTFEAMEIFTLNICETIQLLFIFMYHFTSLSLEVPIT